MIQTVAMIGFGEAGRMFAPTLLAHAARVTAYDRKLDDARLRDGMRHRIVGADVRVADRSDLVLDGATAALSLVTADQALDAARAARLEPGCWWFDMNSVAPDTKRAAAEVIRAAGGRYVDVAVMAPVDPAGAGVPLLVSGPAAGEATDVLRLLGFTDVAIAGDTIGMASSIKMIRSVMVKGIEALSAECAFAAHAAGVLPQVIASLDASAPGADWARRFDYNLDRMMVHGTRRAAEMREVVATLAALGTGAAMTEATVQRQAALGTLGIAPPKDLERKLDVLAPFVGTAPRQDRAA